MFGHIARHCKWAGLKNRLLGGEVRVETVTCVIAAVAQQCEIPNPSSPVPEVGSHRCEASPAGPIGLRLRQDVLHGTSFVVESTAFTFLLGVDSEQQSFGPTGIGHLNIEEPRNEPRVIHNQQIIALFEICFDIEVRDLAAAGDSPAQLAKAGSSLDGSNLTSQNETRITKEERSLRQSCAALATARRYRSSASMNLRSKANISG